MTDISFVLKVVFYRSEAGNEPVREWLKNLHRDDKRLIGEDIKDSPARLAFGNAANQKDRQGLMGSTNKIGRRHCTGVLHG